MSCCVSTGVPGNIPCEDYGKVLPVSSMGGPFPSYKGGLWREPKPCFPEILQACTCVFLRFSSSRCQNVLHKSSHDRTQALVYKRDRFFFPHPFQQTQSRKQLVRGHSAKAVWENTSKGGGKKGHRWLAFRTKTTFLSKHTCAGASHANVHRSKPKMSRHALHYKGTGKGARRGGGGLRLFLTC